MDGYEKIVFISVIFKKSVFIIVSVSSILIRYEQSSVYLNLGLITKNHREVCFPIIIVSFKVFLKQLCSINFFLQEPP